MSDLEMESSNGIPSGKEGAAMTLGGQPFLPSVSLQVHPWKGGETTLAKPTRIGIVSITEESDKRYRLR